MPSKLGAVVPPVDYHIRTRSASRNLPQVVDSPPVVALIPDSDSESEERPSHRLNFDISPVREEPGTSKRTVDHGTQPSPSSHKFCKWRCSG